MALKQTHYFILLLIKDGSANLSFFPVHFFHSRYKKKLLELLWCTNTNYSCLSLSLCFITKGHSLKCYECMGLTDSCVQQLTCPSGLSKCSTAATLIGKSVVVFEMYCHLFWLMKILP